MIPRSASLLAALAMPLGTSAGQAWAQPAHLGPAADSAFARAAAAMQRGHPWQATLHLAPLVRDPPGAALSVRLLAGRAAIAWEGWSEAIRVLHGAAWLDPATAGEGAALLARARLERGDLEDALVDARRAIRFAADDSTRGERQLLLARIHDLAGRSDSAAPHYLAAARTLGPVAEWLRLRAASNLADSAARAELYTGVNDPTAAARIPWAEAQARERTGDLTGAARRYEALGGRLAAIRVRLAAGGALRAAARRQLAELLAPGLSASQTAEAIALFDREFPSRTADEELRIARRAAAVNLVDRAAQGFVRNGLERLTARDRLTYAGLLVRTGRFREAQSLFESIRAPALAGTAAYQQARALARGGQTDQALGALKRVASDFAADAETASIALFLLGDLTTDRGGDDSARSIFARAFAQYPATRAGRRSGFQAALLAWLAGDFGAAAREFDALAAGANGGDESLASLYWAGRAFHRIGDTAAAGGRFRSVLVRAPESYYAALASRRLGTLPPSLPAGQRGVADDRLPAALRRVAALRRLGLRDEAKFELLAFGAGSSPDRLRAAAADLARVGEPGRALRLAQRARDRGAALDHQLASLLYPVPFADLLQSVAQSWRVDPLLLAALIRQESAFDREARSPADARGLMQVLPSVGASYAARVGLAEFDPVLLYQPDVNLSFGTEHLAEALERFGTTEQALAAYNAGGDRVERWLALRGVREDPEVFVERIPFAETRDYVRRVLGNHWMYQALYLPTQP